MRTVLHIRVERRTKDGNYVGADFEADVSLPMLPAAGHRIIFQTDSEVKAPIPSATVQFIEWFPLASHPGTFYPVIFLNPILDGIETYVDDVPGKLRDEIISHVVATVPGATVQWLHATNQT